jgi:hypothetical protein
MFAILDKAKPGTESTRGLNLADQAYDRSSDLTAVVAEATRHRA